MSTSPGFTEWFAWWSWPWRVMSGLVSPFSSLAPQSLYQPILPGWLFANTINVTEENSSSPETERRIVATHSYGQQLGRLIDVVSELIEKRPAGELDARIVEQFTELKDDADKIKAQLTAKRVEQAVSGLTAIRQYDLDEYQRLANELREILQYDNGKSGI